MPRKSVPARLGQIRKLIVCVGILLLVVILFPASWQAGRRNALAIHAIHLQSGSSVPAGLTGLLRTAAGQEFSSDSEFTRLTWRGMPEGSRCALIRTASPEQLQAAATERLWAFDVGSIFAACGDLESAVIYWRRANAAQFFLTRGQVEAQGSHWKSARLAYERAILIDPKSVEANAGLGRVLVFGIGEIPAGIAAYEVAVRLAGRPANWLTVEYAHALNSGTRYLDALEVLAPFGQESAFVELLRGEALFHTGMSVQARDSYLRSVKTEPRNVWAWYGLGEVQLSLGDREGAISSWNRALTIDKSFAPALSARQRLVSQS